MAHDNRLLRSPPHSVKEKLTTKGRHRREGLVRVAGASATLRAPRNDIRPVLEVTVIPIAELRSAGNKTRKLDPAHVREIARSISTFGFCAPVLIGKGNMVIDGEARVEAARQLGMDRVPCLSIDHLTEVEQRTLRLAINRLAERGEWDLNGLKVEFEELLLLDAPIELVGFSADEIDQILLGEEGETVEAGPLSPATCATAVARPGDVFELGPHRLICGDATDPEVLGVLMGREAVGTARLILTDEPYNVPIAGHVSGGDHREFAMASGEMTNSEFLAFNGAWMGAVLPYLREGGVLRHIH